MVNSYMKFLEIDYTNFYLLNFQINLGFEDNTIAPSPRTSFVEIEQMNSLV